VTSPSSPSSTSPTVARWEFARRIKKRRNELDIRIDVVAGHLEFSRNFFSAVENERSMLAVEKLDPLFDLLQLDDQDRVELAALNKAARQRGWWETDTGLPGDEHGLRYVGLEQGASSIRAFESLQWPGLLQMADYARAIFSTDPRRSRVAVDDGVALRQRRQRSLFERGVPVVALVSEAVVAQRWGSEELHQAQIEHVLSLIQTSKVEVRIIPFGTPPGQIAACSTLAFLSFDSPHLPDISYEEAMRGLSIHEDGDPDHEPLQLAWEDGVSRSLSSEQSAGYLAARLRLDRVET
jgi:hypothetical protein